ncbi:LuxR C-terminal-related transcriptional regulator [Actinoplanes xinjiangensis]|uniref:LuxR family maltose regulon positive regulatory protein n=2 Tax=Actinoplanes xinjiangensis TaxID=512350 RepID=A0A316FH81_9ACTN|nr:LuxR C-terminal-related transcriptional regulator [Actinoplanes xinjiangensis]PWK47140.1 LuxR family maltose regulon positive regulatory protein [Actinoplanes xinjiangensis]GIF40298.1 transcriptional regulator [Actinoplanes xinjiangensis]
MSIDMITDSEKSFLTSKFAVPEAPPFMVTRPGLLDRVTEGVRGPVTVITGLAGSGKTQLLASWARSRAVEWPFAWITLEHGDEQLPTFWGYVVEGLRRSGVDVPAVTGGVITRGFLGRLAAAVEEHPTPVVLILDGASQLPGRDWAAGLEYVLSHAGTLRVVLTGRWDPPLPLYRYRLAGLLYELRTADLAFTADEVSRLMRLHGVELAAPELATLLEHTEGWAAGIRLSACALQRTPDAKVLVDTISGDESTIAEYFVGEVLRVQPPETRRFLLETSVLDTFTPELAAAVTTRSDAPRMLAALTRENAFIQPVGSGTGLYRYHRLFAELLRAQLSWGDPGEVALLHQRAALWLAARGHLIDAVGHAVHAGDWTGAARMVIEDYGLGSLVVEGGTGRLGRLFAALPEHVEDPEPVLVRAAVAYGDGDPSRAAEQFTLAGKLIATRGSACDDGLTLACLLMRLLLLAHDAGEDDVDQLAPVARTFLASVPAHRLARHPELPMVLYAAEGRARGAVGQVDEAAAVLAEAVASAPTGAEAVRMSCLENLALLEAFRGRLSRAETAAKQAIDLARQCGLPRERWPAAAEVALAWVALERYDIEAADRRLRAVQPMCGAGVTGPAPAGFALVRARRLQTRGELRQAIGVLASAEEADSAAPRWLSRELRLVRARLLLLAGRAEEADGLLAGYADSSAPDAVLARAALLLARGETGAAYQRARTVADAAGTRVPIALDAWLMLAMVAAGREETANAREALRRALRVAAPESCRRAVNQVWGELRRLLRDDDRLAQQYRSLGAPAPAGTATADPVVVEQLSKRELDVLRGMAEMLPTEEIAASMYVSVNTVKTHVRSILRKLSASRRNEAVRRARALRLI